MDNLMQAIDVFVLPSLFEGIPLTLIEAQTAGLPCVISDKVPMEGVLTEDLVSIKRLSASSDDWAKEIIEKSKTNSRSAKSAEVVKAAGYDICDNAKWLEEFYIEKWKEIESS